MLERYDLGGRIDASAQLVLRFEAGFLGRHQAEHSRLAGLQVAQRLEPADAFRVIFEQERIHAERAEQHLGDGVVAAFVQPAAARVAATDVQRQRDVIARQTFDRGVVRRDHLAQGGVRVHSRVTQRGAVLLVDEDAVERSVHLDVIDPVLDERLDLVANDAHHILEHFRAGAVRLVAYAGLPAHHPEIGGRRQGHLDRPRRVLLEIRGLVAGQPASRPQPMAHHAGRARLGAGARPTPLNRATLWNEALHRVGHISDPRTTPELAVRENFEANLALTFERVEDGRVLLLAQCLRRQRAPGELVACAKELGRTEQAADVVGSKRPGHAR